MFSTHAKPYRIALHRIVPTANFLHVINTQLVRRSMETRRCIAVVRHLWRRRHKETQNVACYSARNMGVHTARLIGTTRWAITAAISSFYRHNSATASTRHFQSITQLTLPNRVILLVLLLVFEDLYWRQNNNEIKFVIWFSSLYIMWLYIIKFVRFSNLS